MGCFLLLFCWYWNSEPGKKRFQTCASLFLWKALGYPLPCSFTKFNISCKCVCAWGMQLMFLWLDKTRFRQNMWPVPVMAVWHGLKNSRHLRICLCLDLHFDVEEIFLKETVLRITCRLTRVTPEWMQRRTESLQVKFVLEFSWNR